MNLQQKLESLTPEQLSAVYKRIFSTDDGMMILEDLKNRCFHYVPTTPITGQIDSYRSAENEGMRKVVLHIQTMLINEMEQPDA